MNNTDFDVLIIGGGPAGSMAGICLTRSGLNVAIIERKTFPRETLCGEFLSKEVMEILKDMNLFSKFLQLDPNKISSLKFATEQNVFTSDLLFDGFSVQRSDFDNFLLKEAESEGAKVIQPAEVKEVLMNRQHFIVKVRAGSEIINVSSEFVVGAYGKSNYLDKKLNRKFSQEPTGYSGIKFHIRKELLPDLDESSIYIFTGSNIYCGINSVNRGEVTVCFLNRKGISNKTAPEHFEELFNENQYLSSLFNYKMPDVAKHQVYGAGNIYFGQKELVKNGVIMIGDAAKVIAPLAGDGIGMAMESARVASDIIIDCNSSRKSFTEIDRAYKSIWSEKFRKRTAIAQITQKIILQKRLLNKIPYQAIKRLIPIIVSATRN